MINVWAFKAIISVKPKDGIERESAIEPGSYVWLRLNEANVTATISAFETNDLQRQGNVTCLVSFILSGDSVPNIKGGDVLQLSIMDNPIAEATALESPERKNVSDLGNMATGETGSTGATGSGLES